ncbi:bifunctional [glutamine synthetase] adenylyltransferase/[glutamine synthetase]-adenylyl-L-tyrosine phosphorylase [Catelliglobosispora koreensis]|uniref:bifunctional [glutamine synthetase] adenylyltransferase/[glutamine synthetase]-adenylyl-L-tyrosine phosphorylase n=1 Tax=Catelliglobosispora koreensis TaxID=129052 RepID=UPI0003828AA1|nr:bifunctional [glutamine synthetase] adenylyltransferase/[glutamine synthetase]-adenylyl-L-tyrosine phosphorylase [Catelliglobosispora koreensis]
MGGIGRLARYGLTVPCPPELKLWDAEHQRPVDEEAALVLEQIGRAADPDLALRQLEWLFERDAAVLDAVLTDEDLRIRLVTVLGASAALGDHWKALRHNIPPRYEVHSGLSTVPQLKAAYQRGLLRIAALDLGDHAGVEWAMTEITALADATLRAAYRIALQRVDVKPRLAVIAMGKCGGGELNYVSDVDVVFVAAEDEDLGPATTVAAALMEICGQVAWQVDANLRPEGSQGPLVRTLASHQVYYQRWARTWEFQALLKARPVAGDAGLGKAWLAGLQPLIWRAAERPEAVDDVRKMRRRIIEQIPPGEADREIKRGPGGLRDIEFAVQLLQLVHGRADETIRSANTLTALRSLVDGGYVGRADGHALDEAYRFLRRVEHALQLQRLRRTHTVPAAAEAVRWLARALGYTVEAFRSAWVAHAAEVRRLHAKLLYRPLLAAVARVPADGLSLKPDAARKRLELLGFADPAGALRHISALSAGVSRTAAIQRTLLPVLLAEFADSPDPDAGLLAYRQVSDALGSTPWYLRLLRDEGPVALRLARVLDSGRYLTDLLSRDPEALRLLASDADLVPRKPLSFMDAAARHTSPEEAVFAVRALRRRELFRIGSADVLGLHDVSAVGPALSDVTDATLAAALSVAAPPEDMRFAIIGMGRLGGAEMSYPSDADVLFVFDGGTDAAALAVAETLRTLLARPAPDPPLGVDADLRPEGRQGPLVRSLSAYKRYYTTWSHVWEAQALLRARPVAGDASLAGEFVAFIDKIRYPRDGLTREQVTEIRRIKARVETERLPRGADPLTHTKLGRGGIADVEWTVQLWQLQHGHAHAGLRTTQTLAALSAATEAGLVSAEDATVLAAAWTLASEIRNAITLIRGRAADQLPRHGKELAGVARLLSPGTEPGEFLDEYLKVTRRARKVVERLFLGSL